MITFEKLDEMIALVPGLKEAHILLNREAYDLTLKHIEEFLTEKASSEIDVTPKDKKTWLPYFSLRYRLVTFNFQAKS